MSKFTACKHEYTSVTKGFGLYLDFDLNRYWLCIDCLRKARDKRAVDLPVHLASLDPLRAAIKYLIIHGVWHWPSEGYGAQRRLWSPDGILDAFDHTGNIRVSDHDNYLRRSRPARLGVIDYDDYAVAARAALDAFLSKSGVSS